MDHRMFTYGKPPPFYSREHLILMSKPELIKIYLELKDCAGRYENLLVGKKVNQKQLKDIEMLEAFSL